MGYVRVASVRPPYTKSEGKPVVLGMRASNPFRNVALLKNLNDVVIASQCSQHPGAVRRLSRIVRLKAAAYVHYRCSASALALACVVSRSKIQTPKAHSFYFVTSVVSGTRPLGLVFKPKPAQAQMLPVGYYLWRTRHSCSARAVDTLILTATCIGHIPRSS